MHSRRIGFLLWIWIGLVSLNASADPQACFEPERAVERFRRTTSATRLNTVLIVPGLNNAPRSLGALADLLLRNGHDVVEVALAGHADDRRPVTLEQWVCDVIAAAQFAIRQSPGTSISVVGFSLGGTITLEVLDERDDLAPRRLILLAPAVSLRTYGYFLRPILWLRYFGVALPSLTPEAFRYAASTPLAHYQQLFRALDATTNLQHHARLQRIPTWIAIHESDEAVSVTRLKRWLSAQDLDWELTVIPAAQGGPEPHHLIAAREHLDYHGLAAKLLEKLAD